MLPNFLVKWDVCCRNSVSEEVLVFLKKNVVTIYGLSCILSVISLRL